MAFAILERASGFEPLCSKVFESFNNTQLLPLYLDLFLDVISAEQDTMVYKIMLSRQVCSQVNSKPAFVVSDLQVPCHQQTAVTSGGAAPRPP